jgi:D-3-phosphoglycerate dehydrogenase/(S)-sulfolactate dehydrogenase
VGRRSPRSEAIMALGTDEATPSELQARIGALPHIQWLKAIQL